MSFFFFLPYLMYFEILIQKNENWQLLIVMKRPKNGHNKNWLTWGQNFQDFLIFQRRVKLGS